MALLGRQIHVSLLLLVAVVALPASTVVASGECYHNAMNVPGWCRAEFIRAVFNNSGAELSWSCCRMLNCTLDFSCFYILQNYCGAHPVWDCGLSGSSKAAPPSGHS